jgi:signal transduction histidine kinase
VADDGRGLAGGVPAQDGDERLGAGLIGVRERARTLRGSLTIDTAPGQGTRLIVEIPLTPTP